MTKTARLASLPDAVGRLTFPEDPPPHCIIRQLRGVEGVDRDVPLARAVPVG